MQLTVQKQPPGDVRPCPSFFFNKFAGFYGKRAKIWIMNKKQTVLHWSQKFFGKT